VKFTRSEAQRKMKRRAPQLQIGDRQVRISRM
jgi:hypothetical protein